MMTLRDYLKQFENYDLDTLVVFSSNINKGSNSMFVISKECEIKKFKGTKKDSFKYPVENEDLDYLELEKFESFKLYNENRDDLGEITINVPVINIHTEANYLEIF